MFRVTAMVNAGHDVQNIVFTIRAPSALAAVNAIIAAMRQLGFKVGDYDLTHSLNLAA